MNDDDRVSEERPSAHIQEPVFTHDDKVPWFLARCTVIFMFLDLIVYLVTRDIAVLLTSTIVGIAAVSVFSYYFSRDKK